MKVLLKVRVLLMTNNHRFATVFKQMESAGRYFVQVHENLQNLTY